MSQFVRLFVCLHFLCRTMPMSTFINSWIVRQIFRWIGTNNFIQTVGGSKGVVGMRPPPGPLFSVQFLSFSCSFRQESSQIIGFCPSWRHYPYRKSWIWHWTHDFQFCVTKLSVEYAQGSFGVIQSPDVRPNDITEISQKKQYRNGGMKVPHPLFWEMYYRSGTLNSNMVNSKFHLIRSFFEILARILSFHV